MTTDKITSLLDQAKAVAVQFARKDGAILFNISLDEARRKAGEIAAFGMEAEFDDEFGIPGTLYLHEAGRLV